jgi:ABC-2 type transport system ATP-binding protein
MIKVDSVSKNFDDVKSLCGVTLNIGDGSVFGLIGSNGSGKSTLLRIISGIYKASVGNVYVDDSIVYENPCVKEKIAYLSDDQYFISGGTIYDMMKLYQSVYPTFSQEKYKKYLTLFELDENRKLSTFSKGMQKQAAFLLGLACNTDYLLCDETLDGLDPMMRIIVRKIVASEVAERGITVIFASHNLNEIEDICDHVALLHKGKLLFEAGLDEIKTGIHKVQLSFNKESIADGKRQLEELDTVSLNQRGSLFTVIVRGDEKYIDDYMRSLNPVFVEFIPLTLEEIFIAEMEERGYEFNDKFNS